MRRTPGRLGGYTLIEVMTAVVVMTIGATGILAMQGASVRSNQDANETSVAINFATTWIERIKRDAARQWTTTGVTAMNNTTYLRLSDTYYIPLPADARESYGADYFGFDTRTEGCIYFCVNMRGSIAHAYNPLDPGAVPDLANDVNALRTDVRVWWYRWGPDADRNVGPRCNATAGVLSTAQLDDPRIRKHYLSTVVTWRAP